MKKKHFINISLFLMLTLIPLIGFSVQIKVYGTNETSLDYCFDEVPGGTFRLYLDGVSCPGHTYTWASNNGSGWTSIGSTCISIPITDYISYPTVTTTYRCISDAKATYYFYVTVYNPTLYTVGGDNCCCASNCSPTLSGSQGGAVYKLYQDGNYMSGYDKNGTGSALTFTAVPYGHTYTVLSVWNYCDKWMDNNCVLSHYCCKGTTSESDETLIPNVKVYPNPNGGSFTIENGDIGEYVLYNEVGQEVQQIKFTSPNTNIEIKGLKPGNYFLKNKDGSTSNDLKITVVE